jgi:hypothetical protein
MFTTPSLNLRRIPAAQCLRVSHANSEMGRKSARIPHHLLPPCVGVLASILQGAFYRSTEHDMSDCSSNHFSYHHACSNSHAQCLPFTLAVRLCPPVSSLSFLLYQHQQGLACKAKLECSPPCFAILCNTLQCKYLARLLSSRHERTPGWQEDELECWIVYHAPRR